MTDDGSVALVSRARVAVKVKADLAEMLGSGFLAHIAATFGSRAVVLAIGIATSVIVTRALGPDGRGLFATAVAISAIGIQLGNLGMHSSNTWAIARDRALLGALVANSMLVSAVVGGGIVAIVTIAANIWPTLTPVSGDLMILALAAIPVGLAYLLLQNLLLGLERIRAYNVVEVINRAGAACVLLAIAALGLMTPSSAFAAITVMVGIGVGLALLNLRRGEPMAMSPSKLVLLDNARFGLRAYVAAMIAFLLLRVDILLVQAILGSEATGYYAVAVTLADNVYLLPVVVGSLLFARLAGSLDSEYRWRVARTAAIAVALVMAAVALIAFLFAADVIRFLYGAAFASSVEPFLWLLPGIVLLSINTVFMNLFAAEGMPRVAIVAPFVGLILNVILNLALISPLGITGAALASTVAYGTMLAISLLHLRSRGQQRNTEP